MEASKESNEVTTTGTVKLEQIQTFEEGMAQHEPSKAKWACFSKCVENLPVITSRLLSKN